MLPRRYLVISLLIVLVAVACSSAPAPPDANEGNAADSGGALARLGGQRPVRILHLDSYHPDYLWSVSLDAGIRVGLAEYGYDTETDGVTFETLYMDTKRNTSPAYFEAIGEEMLTAILDNPPDVLIATDNNAIRLVVQPLLDADIPIVFAGLNDQPETYGLTTARHVTGVVERVHIEETIHWIHRALPEADSIVGIFDNSVSSASYSPAIEKALSESDFADHYALHLVDTFEEWQEMIQRAPDQGDLILIGTYHTLTDSEGRPVHEDEVIGWTVEHSALPLVGLWDFNVYQGAIGGSVISGESQGYEAGKLAARILNGEPIDELPIVIPARGKLLLNADALRRWQVAVPLDLVQISMVLHP
ncbi:MAG: hypothetical protein Kow0077_07410 [Anaerolineae bacterium]